MSFTVGGMAQQLDLGNQSRADAGVGVSPPAKGHSSDDWVVNGNTPWQQEMERRETELIAYLEDTDGDRSVAYGFKVGHTPALAWNWFAEHPVGFGGPPYVLLKTILSLDPATEKDPHLLRLAEIWKKKSEVPSEADQETYTLDHLGVGPNPEDYENGIAKSPDQRVHLLPNGFVYDPTVEVEVIDDIDKRLKLKDEGVFGRGVRWFAGIFGVDYDPKFVKKLGLVLTKIRKGHSKEDIDYETESHLFQQPPKVDAVFFSCSGCHQGRVIVGAEFDSNGDIVKPGEMKFLPGMPNTEIEQQYYAGVLMQTGLALIESGFSIDATELPNPDEIKPNKEAVIALYTRMLNNARDPEIVKTIYGSSPEQIERAKLQTYWILKDFSKYLGDLIGVAIKTQYIYHQIAKQHAFNPNNPKRDSPEQKVPDVLNNRIGQMDAFGIASGLVAIHSLRPDNSYIEFMYQDNPDNPIFTGIDDIDGFDGAVGPDKAGARILKNLKNWVPPVPAPIDIKSLNWSAHRDLANWDGNQGAAARTLASGTSATGDSRKTNVRIHEPLNPFINNLPPPPYPFDIDREKALRGMAIFKQECAGCHKPNNNEIIPAAKLGVDENRSLVNTDVSRYGLAALVMESCRIFIKNNPDNDWCLPRNDEGEVITDVATAYDDYFKDTPGRVRAAKNGYKVDMLHGIWARAPYLHNGSVPTLMNMLCPDTRPKKFLRGVIYYDTAMVGFEWQNKPKQRYSPYETVLVKTYDTSEFGRDNGGHEYGAELCPDTKDLDISNNRKAVVERISASKAGDLLEYLKTL